MSQLLTLKQVADALGLKVDTTRAWLSRRKLERWRLWLSLGAAIGRFVQMVISFFHGTGGQAGSFSFPGISNRC